MVTTGGAKGKSKAQVEREKVLAMLDAADQEVPKNPGLFNVEAKHGESFADLFEQSLDERDFKVGDIVKGRVLEVQEDYVLVDINYKSEGLIPISEFRVVDGQAEIEVGSDVEVYIDRVENENGMVVLSKDKADMLRAWTDISRAAENEEVIEGTIIAKVKGGLSVDIGVKAFLPGSQIDLRPVRNIDSFIGKKYKFKVIKFNKKRGNIVLSRRALLEEERESLRSQTLDAMKEGSVVQGVVKNITDYGAFIDLGGMDGLLHITDMSWGRVKHPSELVNVGDEIEVKVLKFDNEKERVSLGLKQLRQDPWDSAVGEFPPGKKVKGKVVSLADYGAFVELAEGVEGLIHVSEMSWTKRVKHPSQLVKVGDDVEVQVLEVDTANRRISLGMKQLEQNPWLEIKESYPPGTIIEGEVKSITDFGIFIGVDEGIDGMVHVSDFSWTKRINHPSEMFKKGDKVRAVVLGVDIENERVS
jgi:small subunit ribosomal protein S1